LRRLIGRQFFAAARATSSIWMMAARRRCATVVGPMRGTSMEMHQVRYFLALRTERSFTRAAKRCGVSQPTLTRAIKLLERELGGELFLRRRNANCLSNLGFLIERQIEAINRAAARTKTIAAGYRASRPIFRPTLPRLVAIRP
jgi:DNA-binding transcriptional LysR family regulator